MEGIDKHWQIVGDQHQVRFSNLPAGNYVLKIKASYDGHTWDEDGRLSLPVHVKAPWWASVPAFAVYFIIAAFVLVYTIKFSRARMMLGMQLKAEQEKRLNIEKMNRQKLDFFAYVSHDLKTPLSLITGPVSRILMAPVDVKIKEQLEIVLKNAEKLKMATVETAKQSERGIVDMETLKATNESLISTLDEVMQIQQEGRQKRAEAERGLREMEQELKAKLLEIRG